jgi:hypothetical protein
MNIACHIFTLLYLHRMFVLHRALVEGKANTSIGMIFFKGNQLSSCCRELELATTPSIFKFMSLGQEIQVKNELKFLS